jgi:2-polyprenyl-3-methyl-5-hydroxy-6-metoxy-1,4-benzoquinol methylase
VNITNDEWVDSQAHELGFWRKQYYLCNHEQADRWFWYSKWLFRNWFEFTELDGLRLLDYGSGPTGVLHHIHKAGRKVAVDPLMGEFETIGYDIRSNDVIALESIPEEKFDVIFCLNVLDHTGNPAAVLNMLAEHMADNGRMVFCVDLRPVELRDKYHKINLTDEFMRNGCADVGLVGERRLIPHQAGNPTMQWCAVLSLAKDSI